MQAAGVPKRLLALLATTSFLLAACSSSAPAAAPTPVPTAASTAVSASADWQVQWNSLVDAASKEGQVTIYGPTGGNYQSVFVDAFRQAFPNITVNYTGGGPELPPKIIAERQAGQYLPDLEINGTTTVLSILKPAGALDPIPPLLIRPDVTDASKWFANRLWYSDDDQQLNLMFEGSVSQVIAVNTDQVDPSTVKSYWDLLDPKYKGKVVSSDIRQPGPGGGQSRFIITADGLGPPFLEKLFGEMAVTLTSDRRQLADWLAQGKYAVAYFPGTNEIDDAINQGLPVAYVDNRKLKEGFPVSAAFGAISVMNQRPHPAAAQLFLNWVLSPDGQLAYQKAVGTNSLRVDIPKDAVAADNTLPPDADPNTIFFASMEKYQSIELTQVQDIITRALGTAQ